MAALPNPPFVSVDDYLNSSYHPDVEFVDGALVERSVPSIPHSLLHFIVGGNFLAHREHFGFAVLAEPRTRIVERARYRIPDIMLCPVPLPEGNVVTSVPWVVIEILSPNDQTPELLRRFRDFKKLGVLHVVLLDPEEPNAFRFEDGSLLRTQFTSLDLPTGSVPFDTAALFRQLEQERSRGRT